MLQVSIVPIIDPGVTKLATGLQSGTMNKINLQMYNLGRMAQRMFREETSHWSKPPSFSISGSAQQGHINVSTTDQKFIWYDDGTRPHVITARSARALAFRAASGKGKVGKGSKGSGSTVFVKKVYHPGTRARNVSQRIAHIIEPMLVRYVEAAIADSL